MILFNSSVSLGILTHPEVLSVSWTVITEGTEYRLTGHWRSNVEKKH